MSQQYERCDTSLPRGRAALTALRYVFAIRRLPGLRLPFLRTLIDGVIAFLVASPIIVAGARPFATDELTTLLPVLRRLPRHFDRISASLKTGCLGVNVHLLADDRDRRYVTGLVHRILLAFLAATGGIIGVLMLGVQGGLHLTSSVPSPSFSVLLCFLVVSTILALRVLVAVLRSDTT